MQGVRGSNPLSSTRHNTTAGHPLRAVCQRFARVSLRASDRPLCALTALTSLPPTTSAVVRSSSTEAQGRPCWRPPAALRPGNDTSVTGGCRPHPVCRAAPGHPRPQLLRPRSSTWPGAATPWRLLPPGSLAVARQSLHDCTRLERGRWGCRVGAAAPSDGVAAIVVRPRGRSAACGLPAWRPTRPAPRPPPERRIAHQA
jgi:hypothetical protein